jgi:hypothetical protein
MKKTIILSAVTAMVIVFYAFTDKYSPSSTIQQTFNDSLDADRAKYVALVLAKIKGKEKFPVDSVFTNLKIFKGFPAERLLKIMELGYSRSLGVSCGHCHNTDDFASDEKKEKDIAREMSSMTGTINNQLLKNIPGLAGTNAIVNCTTCHRGQIKPALDLETK